MIKENKIEGKNRRTEERIEELSKELEKNSNTSKHHNQGMNYSTIVVSFMCKNNLTLKKKKIQLNGY